jgi:phytoene/squalene synthetase
MSPHLTPRAANALTVMRCIYEGILDQILSRDCDVWSRRPKLSALRKARILLPVLFNSGLGNLISD